MKIIVCLDDKNGMLFNNRRQSSDRLLRERILLLTKGARLWMNTYSANQFAQDENILVDEHFMEKAEQGDYCFVENTDVLPFAEAIEAVVVYCWNAVYPSDMHFPTTLLEGKTRISAKDFAGYSHPKITEEIYEW